MSAALYTLAAAALLAAGGMFASHQYLATTVHEHPHLADGPVHHAGRDVHHAALAHRAFLPVEHHRALHRRAL